MLKHKPDFTAQRQAGREYYDLWKELQAAGFKPTIIARSDHDAWQAWIAYYRRKGLIACLDLMDDGRAEKTVPTRHPSQFEQQPIGQITPDRRVKDD
jgi:hypothetical protein